jgi:hypothetical protein
MAQTFSGRPLIILELLITGNTPSPSGNTTFISWQLQARETASQPSFGLDATRTASVNFVVSGGGSITSTSYTFGTTIFWNYDYRPTGLQTKVIGTGNFTVTHNSAGTGGTVSALATANDPTGNLGSADHSITPFGLSDYDRGPSWSSFNIPSPTIRGNGYFGQVIANAASSYGLINGTSVPSGLTFNSNGTITGTPDTVQSRSFTFRAFGTFEGSTDSSATIEVRPRTPVFTDTSFATAIRGISYSDAVSATEAASYSRSGTIPPGLTFNSNGTITGTPTTLGSFPFTVFATNVTGTGSAGVTLVVNRPTPVYTDNTVSSSATLGLAYSDSVSATDATSYSINSGSLPPGISLNTSTGAITGTPTAVGTFTFVIRASNETGGVNTSSQTITVISPIRVNTATGPTANFVTGLVRVNTATGPTANFVNGVIRVWNGTAFVPARLT